MVIEIKKRIFISITMSGCHCKGGLCGCPHNSAQVPDPLTPKPNITKSDGFVSILDSLKSISAPVGSYVMKLPNTVIDAQKTEDEQNQDDDADENDGYGIQKNEPWRTKHFWWHDLFSREFIKKHVKNFNEATSKKDSEIFSIRTLYDKIKEFPGVDYAGELTKRLNHPSVNSMNFCLSMLDRIYEYSEKIGMKKPFINNWYNGAGSANDAGVRLTTSEAGSEKSDHKLGVAFDLHSNDNNKLWNAIAKNWATWGIHHIENKNHTPLPSDAAADIGFLTPTATTL